VNTLQQLSQQFKNAGGRALIVGGAVRDAHLGIESKDIDIEVYGLPATTVAAIAARFGPVNAAGKRFGVLKVHTDVGDIDISLPRTENKIGAGRKGFLVETDKDLTPKQAAMRRDYTMNSAYKDPLTGEVIDPFQGFDDLDAGLLRITNADTFAEDPTRVLRGMQFCGRFDLIPTTHTVDVCGLMYDHYHEIAEEMRWVEWEKWASKSTKPSQGLKFLRDTGWIWHYPALQALIGTRQDPVHHPEGTVWEHTLQVVDQLAGKGAVAVFAGLLHDVGKPQATQIVDGRIQSKGHAEAGLDQAERFLKSIGAPRHITEQVIALVANHMFDDRGPISKRAVRRLSVRLGTANITQLSDLMLADRMGRVPYGHAASHCARCGRQLTDTDSIARGIGPVCLKIWRSEGLLERARELQCEQAQPKPILMGRHLLERNWMKPGPEMGKFLRFAYDLQLDGIFDDLDGALSVCWNVFEHGGSSIIEQLWSKYDG